MPLDLQSPPWWQWALLIPCLAVLYYLLHRGLRLESTGPPRMRWGLADFLVGVLLLVVVHQSAASGVLYLGDLPLLPRGWAIGAAVVVAGALTSLVVLLWASQLGLPGAVLGLFYPRLPRNVLSTVLACLSFFAPCWIVTWAWVRLIAALGHTPTAQPVLEVYLNAWAGDDRSEMVAIGLGAVLAAPLAEELIFRGFIFGMLREGMGASGALLVSSAAFAAFHWQPEVLVPLFLVGLVLNLIYLRTGCLAYSILFHALFNGATLALGPRL